MTLVHQTSTPSLHLSQSTGRESRKVVAITNEGCHIDPADMTNDQIRKELSAIAIELTVRDAADFDGRIDLRDRRLALRGEIATRSVGPTDVASMRRELVGLERRLETILDDRPNVAAMNDGGEGQRSMAENQQVGWDYDEGTGRNAIEDRVCYLRRRIAESEA